MKRYYLSVRIKAAWDVESTDPCYWTTPGLFCVPSIPHHKSTQKKGKGEGGYLASIFVGNIEKTKELRIVYTAREEVKYRKAKEDDKSSRVHI